MGAGATSAIGALIYGSTNRGSFLDEVGQTHSAATLVVGNNWASNSDGSVLNVYSAAGDGRLFVGAGGNVGIGTTNPQYPLSVNGTVQAKEVIVNTGWSDYVFGPEYKLQSLNDVAAFVKQNHHLPGIPPEADVKKNGVGVGEMQSKLLAKVEELTLQLIRLNDKTQRLEHDNKSLEQRLHQLEKR